MGEGWRRTKRITSAAFRPVRGRDLSLHAAAITFYGAIAVVPVALLELFGHLAWAVDGPEVLFETELDGLLAQLRPAGPSPRAAARH